MSTYPGRILSGRHNQKGYLQVDLHCGHGKMAHPMVHRLIAEAFLGPIPPGHQVNHKNGIKHDNRLDNLEYVTASGNLQHAYDTGLKLVLRGSQHGRAKLTENEVVQIRAALARGEKRAALARVYGVTKAAITDIARNKNWRHVA